MTNSKSVVTWPVEKVIPYEKNAKIHDDEQIEKLAESIQRFGWTAPIVVDRNGVIIAGHGRRLAALKLGLKKVPVIVRDDLSDTEVKALRLADNRNVGQLYNTELIGAELMEINLEDPSLAVAAGFDQSELEKFTKDFGEFDPDAFVEDLEEEIEAQVEESKEKIREIDSREVPIAKVFGFKSVPAAKERVIRHFMAQLEEESGLKGADALIDFIERQAEPAEGDA